MTNKPGTVRWQDEQRRKRGSSFYSLIALLIGTGALLSAMLWGPSHLDQIEERLATVERTQAGLLSASVFLESAVIMNGEDIAVLRLESEALTFRYVQAQNAIMFLNPKVDRFLSWRIAYYTVIVADSYGIDPFLVLSLMHRESNFNPKARSKVGAIGLMQVMPFWADDYGLRIKDLWEFKTNIDTGVAIFNSCLNDCNQDLSCALGRYHGSYPARGDDSYAGKVQATYEKVQKKFE